MASTTVSITAIAGRVSAADEAVRTAMKDTDNLEDLHFFGAHADRLKWIAELSNLSTDGKITLDSADMESIWHWSTSSDDEPE